MLIEAFMLSETELRYLHRHFGYPSIARLESLLRRANQDFSHKVIERIEKYCHYCQKYGQSPHRFRFAIHDDKAFNESIVVDILYLE